MRPQDIVVALKLAAHPGQAWTYEELGHALGLSASVVHGAVRRLARAGLVNQKARRVVAPALLEFAVHGVRYVWPAERGRVTRGMPTAASASPLVERLASSGDSIVVWPYALGTARGEALLPLHPCVPAAAAKDAELYALLSLLDGIRAGGARVREVAASVLRDALRAA